MGFPVVTNESGNKVIEIVPDKVVAILEGAFVTINAKNPLNDDPYDYDSVHITKEQLDVLAKQVKEMR